MKKTFVITVSDTLQRDILIESETREQALNTVKKMYELKNFMKYSKNKKQWYFTPLPYKRVKQTVSMTEIRNHYGSKIYKNEQPEPDKITA